MARTYCQKKGYLRGEKSEKHEDREEKAGMAKKKMEGLRWRRYGAGWRH